MSRKISTFIFFGLIFTLVVWNLDKQSRVIVDWRGYHSELTVPDAMLLVLIAVAVVDFVNRIFRRLILMTRFGYLLEKSDCPKRFNFKNRCLSRARRLRKFLKN